MIKGIAPQTSLAFLFLASRNRLVNNEIIRQGYGHAHIEYPFDPAKMEELRATVRVQQPLRWETGSNSYRCGQTRFRHRLNWR